MALALQLFEQQQDRVLFTETETISQQQQARYWFLGSQIAYGNRQWGLALSCLLYAQEAQEYVDKQDWESIFEIGRWQMMANMRSHRTTIAPDQFDALLLVFNGTRRFRFIYGDQEGFYYHLRYLRAKTLFRRGSLDASLIDIAACMAHVYRWLLVYARKLKRPELATLAEQFQAHPTAPVTIPCNMLFPETSSTKDEDTVINLLEFYSRLIWLKAEVSYWREKVSPHREAQQGYTQLDEAFQWLDVVISLCERVPTLSHMLPHCNRARAEVALLLSNFQCHQALRWLTSAEEMLGVAEGHDIIEKETRAYIDSPEIGMLMNDLCEMQRIRIVHDGAKFKDFRYQVAALCKDVQAKEMGHLAGRCYILLGEISAELMEYALADSYYLQANRIFEEEGDTLRTAELRQLRKDLESEQTE